MINNRAQQVHKELGDIKKKSFFYPEFISHNFIFNTQSMTTMGTDMLQYYWSMSEAPIGCLIVCSLSY